MNTFEIINNLNTDTPKAYASINGVGINGTMLVYRYQEGSILVFEVTGLPNTGCNQGIHGLHIHKGATCTGSKSEPFSDVDGHFSLNDCLHPYHSGDLPPLFSLNGNAWMAVYIQKFIPEQIVGRTVIVHEQPDDFTTQPSGNAGKMIACGEIIELYQ